MGDVGFWAFGGGFWFGCVSLSEENYPPLQAMFFHFAIQSTLFLLVYNCITALYNGITARRGLF